jgi:propanol-preferring alcohol dehydrogenase
MRAYQLLDWQKAGFRELEVPEPGPGQVRVRIGGAGLCHSDLLFLDAPAGRWPFALPMTLGHENAGWVDRIGPGVDGFALGDAVLIETHWWCRRCEFCRVGADNYCIRGWGRAHGVGAPGGLAPYLVTEVQQLVPLGALEPIDVAPLSDAGRTSYHAVKKDAKLVCLDAPMVGVGGLAATRSVAAHASPACVVASTSTRRLWLPRSAARRTLISDAAAAGALRRSPAAAPEAVFDRRRRRDDGARAGARILGPWRWSSGRGNPHRLGEPPRLRGLVAAGRYQSELHEVVSLPAPPGLASVERFAFDDTPLAYERLRAGDLAGRAVVLPSLERRAAAPRR